MVGAIKLAVDCEGIIFDYKKYNKYQIQEFDKFSNDNENFEFVHYLIK